jgi:hypothetical protein
MNKDRLAEYQLPLALGEDYEPTSDGYVLPSSGYVLPSSGYIMPTSTAKYSYVPNLRSFWVPLKVGGTLDLDDYPDLKEYMFEGRDPLMVCRHAHGTTVHDHKESIEIVYVEWSKK